MNKIPYAKKKQTSYENFVGECPWYRKESIFNRAINLKDLSSIALRTGMGRILNRHISRQAHLVKVRYPPDKQKKATETVVAQAKLLVEKCPGDVWEGCIGQLLLLSNQHCCS